jgi:hypothetical protein
MPWWALLYLLVCVATSIAGDAAAFHTRKTIWWVLDALHGLVFAALFASYWVEAVQLYLRGIAPALFVAALAWELYSGPADVREVWGDPELSKKEKLAMSVATPIFFLPLYIFAGIAAFRQTS